MKFQAFKRLSADHRRRKRSTRDLTLKYSKKKLFFSWWKKFSWRKKKVITNMSLPIPHIEELEKEFMHRLEQYHFDQTNNVHERKRLLITHSMDDFPDRRRMRKRLLYATQSAQPIHQVFLARSTRRTTIKTQSDLSLIHNRISRSTPSSRHVSEQSQAAFIEINHQPLEKSHSSPLPINTNFFSLNSNAIQSAHLMNPYAFSSKSKLSFYACTSIIGEHPTMTDTDPSSSTSDEEDITRSLLQCQTKANEEHLSSRWSISHLWKTTQTKLPPIINCIWRQRVHQTGSREFLLEYDQTIPMNSNNNSKNATNLPPEERYVEQERPIQSHIGLALLALLIFPPIGIFAMIFSLWSVCGQQDRHLSRKFGIVVYWMSILAIILSFLLLLTLFSYFTYQYLTNQANMTEHDLTSHPVQRLSFDESNLNRVHFDN